MDPETDDTTTSSESGDGEQSLIVSPRAESSSNRSEEQGLQINLAISSGLARLYSMLTQADGGSSQGGITLGGLGTGDSDSDDEDYTPSFSCRRQRQSMPKRPPKPDPEQVAVLQKSDYFNETQGKILGEDLKRSHRFDVHHNMLNVIQNREMGDVNGHRFGHFTRGAKSQILSQLLPNFGKTVAEFRQKVFCGTYSRCGDLFMSAGQDQKIRLYDTRRGQFKLKRTIQARNVGWSVLDVALSPDNCHLIYSSWCDSIHQVSLFHEDDSEHTALPLLADDNGRFCIFSLRFSANGDEILGGANNGYIYIYDRFAQTRSLRIDAHDDDVNAVAFVDEATHILASGGDDGLIKIWDRRSLKESNPHPVGVFAGHVDGITFIDAREDARHIISNSKDQSIKLWDLRKFANNQCISLTKDAIRHRGWDYRWGSGQCPDTRRGSKIEDDPSIMTYKGHSVFKTLIRCRFSPAHSTGQKFIYTGCGTGAIKIYDALTGEIVKTLKEQSDCVRDVSWHPYLNEIVGSSWDRTIVKWDYKSQDVLQEAEEKEELAKCKMDKSKRRRLSELQDLLFD